MSLTEPAFSVQEIKPGLYRVFWKRDGSSFAAVGMTGDGGRWLAPINWIYPTRHQPDWALVDWLEAIEVSDVFKRVTAAEPACSECARLRKTNAKLLSICKTVKLSLVYGPPGGKDRPWLPLVNEVIVAMETGIADAEKQENQTMTTVNTAKDDVAYVCSVDGETKHSLRHATENEAWAEARGRHDAGQPEVRILQVSLVGVITE